MSWKLHGCPRCGGAVHVHEFHEQGVRKPYENCLQCGWENVDVPLPEGHVEVVGGRRYIAPIVTVGKRGPDKQKRKAKYV